MSILLIADLVFSYPNQGGVLQGINLKVEPGEVFCLLGANGSGKSTLLACVLGFLRPNRGRILVDGVDCLAEPDRARTRVAYLPESVALWGFLTGLEHLRLAAELLQVEAREKELLAQVGLPEAVWRKPVARYSKGMRQKLALAAVGLRQPKVALLDEPTSGLDPESAAAVVKLVRSLADTGVGVLAVTHDVWLLGQLADRWGLLRDGVIHEGKVSPALPFLEQAIPP